MFLGKLNQEILLNAIDSMEVGPREALVLLLGESGLPDIHVLLSVVQERGITFCGGIFPGLIYQDKRHESGCILKKFPVCDTPFVLHEDEAIRNFSYNPGSFAEGTSVLVWADGLSGKLTDFFDELHAQLGASLTFLGAGAGSLSLQQAPCVFTQDGIFQDAVVGMVIDNGVQLGVAHGWERLAEPLVATRAERNRLYELNWESAFSIYQKTIWADTGKKIGPDNFFEIAKEYPFGIFKSRAEDIVRDPIKMGPSGELICVGDIPENAVLNILKGKKESLVASASEAAQNSIRTDQEPEEVLVIDCISRVLFLEDNFPDELKAVNDHFALRARPIDTEGVLSIGEISSHNDGSLEFFNKTIVVGSIYA